MTSKVVYSGQLNTIATHILSNNNIQTDAPLDNGGQGQAFSPTDLVATALASCMLTIMGIAANTHNINIEGSEIEITKYMEAAPRRISKIDAIVHMKGELLFSDKMKHILENAARTCPVFYSLNESIEKNIVFHWD